MHIPVIQITEVRVVSLEAADAKRDCEVGVSEMLVKNVVFRKSIDSDITLGQ
jgi:hypothetical protein